MRIDPGNVDKFAALFKAGKKGPKRKKPKQSEVDDNSLDDEIVGSPRLYKTFREKQIEAVEYERRRAKRAKALHDSRLDRIAATFSGARRFFRTLDKVAPTCRAIGYRDVDIDLGSLATQLDLKSIPDNYDRFHVYLRAVDMVGRVAKRAGYTEHDPEEFFQVGIVTALDELKTALNLT